MGLTAVIFGGAGFIGCHFSAHLLSECGFDHIYLCDLKPPEFTRFGQEVNAYSISGKIKFVECDVRQPIDISVEGDVTLIANFAAVHREPGHENFEYYETNLLGAEYVCMWAEEMRCNSLLFTSSIAPYGITENLTTENTLPVPFTAYGGSKLVAEKIHNTWQAGDKANRKLVIVRPGVVFGPGEGGNVTRLVKAVLGRYFFYMGNKQTNKAGTYVKELCNAVCWVLSDRCEKDGGVSLFNMSLNPGPTIEEYVNTICEVAAVKRTVPSAPYNLVYATSLVVASIAKLFGISQPIDPVRIAKLRKSNNVIPQYLRDFDYKYRYTFKEAMSDWRASQPNDWR
jgi:nucleoside-diphosphate-sugar epimerase